MNDIYTKERQRFVKSYFPYVCVQGLLSKDQLIDCLSVTGGLLLVSLLLAFWKPQDPNEPQELSTKPA